MRHSQTNLSGLAWEDSLRLESPNDLRCLSFPRVVARGRRPGVSAGGMERPLRWHPHGCLAWLQSCRFSRRMLGGGRGALEARKATGGCDLITRDKYRDFEIEL